MKRLLMTLAVAAATLVPAGSRAALPPSLVETNIVKTTGSKVASVYLTRQLAVAWYDPIWSGAITTNGTYGGYALVQVTPRKQGRIIMVMQLSKPAGCRLDGTYCSPIRVHYVKGPNDPGRINMSAGVSTVLEAGTYLLYGFTDPGKSLTATVKLRGLQDSKTWWPASVTGMAVSQSIPPLHPAAPMLPGVTESKALTGRLTNRGLLIGGVWATPSNGFLDPSDPTRTTTGGATVAAYTQCWGKKTAQDTANTCGFGSNPAGAQPDLAFDNIGLSQPLFSWQAAGEYGYAYNAVAVTGPPGRFGGYALWWTTG